MLAQHIMAAACAAPSSSFSPLRRATTRELQWLLRRAAEQAPANSVVQDHFGDVLWAAGKRPEARKAYDQARALGVNVVVYNLTH